jgi:hypothetical protein
MKTKSRKSIVKPATSPAGSPFRISPNAVVITRKGVSNSVRIVRGIKVDGLPNVRWSIVRD